MNIKEVLKEELKRIKPSKEELEKINSFSKKFIVDLNKGLKANNISADVFIGGSNAKDTLIKKDKYDVDVFVRFNKKYAEKDISSMLGKVLKNASRVHGSRDYFQINNNGIVFEIIPVINIKKPNEALNVTDLSYFHVKYVVDRIKKNRKLADEIRLAKAFCHAIDCYGAESYIKGFSGYALELLIVHYKSFLNFLKNIADSKERIIIDDSKFFKNKKEVLIEMNESKIQSPIILIDPTFKERNALAGLGEECFMKLKSCSEKFLKNPLLDFFVKKDAGKMILEKYKDKAIVLNVKSNKQAGDIAGTKLKKFFGFFINQLKREFIVKVCEFEYDDMKNIGYYYIVLEKKNEETIRGPPMTNPVGLSAFKKAHANAFIKDGFAYAKISHNLGFNDYLKKFISKNKKLMKDMSIIGIKKA